MPKVILVPPDGGYGWVIVCATAVNAFLLPIIQSFGLIFKDVFSNLGMSAAQSSLILNMNLAFGMLTGFINGALLKRYGYRKVSFGAAVLVTGGIILTSFSHSFAGYIVTYGIITSLGIGVGMSSYNLALNTYFKANKGRAVAIATTLTGFGPIIIPQLVTYLMRMHTVQGVILILGAIASHSFIASILLQPVKRHMKREVVEDDAITRETELERVDEEAEQGEETVIRIKGGRRKFERSTESTTERKKKKLGHSISLVEDVQLRKKKESIICNPPSIDYDQESAGLFGLDSGFGGSIYSLNSDNRISIPSHLGIPFRTKWWSTSTITVNSSAEDRHRSISESVERYRKISRRNTIPEFIKIPEEEEEMLKKTDEPKCEQTNRLKRVMKKTAKALDLNLLKDPIYVNIMLGMSFAVFAEINFAFLTAFILKDFGLTTEQIATFMSTVGVTDIIFRFLAPFIGDLVGRPPREMYMISLLLLIITRFGLLISSDYKIILCVAAFLGVARGIRTVYMSLVIPTYVPLEKLASASGIQMMVNGVCIITGGPMLGVVRDWTGSYKMCIVIMNCITFTTFVMWLTEMVIFKLKKKQEITENMQNLENI